MEPESVAQLLPCPFCGAGETQIQPTLYWTGMRQNVLSVTIRHWCQPLGAIHGTLLQVKGKTEEEAIASWNRLAVSASEQRLPTEENRE